MASSKPINKMLYLTLNENFGKQQAQIMRNVVLYDKEKCTSLLKYGEKNVNGKIILSLETKMSPKDFVEFASKRINSVNHTLLYGVWNIGRSAAICFHNLADLTDKQDWVSRSWVFDSETDVFVSRCEEDSLTRHDLNKEDLLIF